RGERRSSQCVDKVLPYTLRMAMKILHIVDGESTGGALRQAGFLKNGDILPWRDALYTGPVPRGLTLRQLSRLRSRFWTGKSITEFDKRDAVLARHADYEEVVLWFGPTSICQLSLVQLLTWFGEQAGAASPGLRGPPAGYLRSKASCPARVARVLRALARSTLPPVNDRSSASPRDTR